MRTVTTALQKSAKKGNTGFFVLELLKIPPMIQAQNLLMLQKTRLSFR